MLLFCFLRFNLSLQQRVEFLSLAVSNSKSFSHSQRKSSSNYTVSTPSDHVAFTTDLDERLEVAKVQIEVQHALSQDMELDDQTKAEYLRRLNETLLDINELYHNFVKPNQLYEQTLHVLHVSGQYAPELVRETWAILIEEARLEAERAHVDEFERVSSAVVDIAKRFIGSENAFPVDVLTLMLQDFAFNHEKSSKAGWAPETMLMAGAEVEQIFDVLDDVFETKVGSNQSNQKD